MTDMTRTLDSVIREAAPTPSAAIRLALAGWRDGIESPEFEVQMQSYGNYDEVDGKGMVCVGCLAVCALQRVLGKPFTPSALIQECGIGLAAELLGLEDTDLVEHEPASTVQTFEAAINAIRFGQLNLLFRFYRINRSAAIQTQLEVRSLLARLVTTPILGGESNSLSDRWPGQMTTLEEVASALERMGY